MASPRVVPDPVANNNLEIWKMVNADLARIKATEMQYRLALEKQIQFTDKEEGSQTVVLPDTSRLQLTRTWNYSLIEDTSAIHQALNELYAIDPGAALSVITYKPVLSESAYKKLPEDQRRIIARVVSRAPGTPSLEWTRPKA
jgi:hypothetical protein